MEIHLFILLCILIGVTGGKYQFPSWFQFGAASSAHQVEGGWNASDKTSSIWDHMERNNPIKFPPNKSGAVACDSYHLWRRDVEMVSELGLDFYRFSISWTRLLPTGYANHISEDGKMYYSNLIDELIRNNVQPVVTIYHFDLPQSLQDLGGWTNPLVVDWFGDYARVVYSLYADRVKTWLTINEPLIFCEVSYGMGLHAPGIMSPGVGNYLCSKHALLAHAKAWRIYDEEFRHIHHGRVSLANQLMWFQGENDEDETAELLNQYGSGLFSHPIYSDEGGWPAVIETIIEKKSNEEGYVRSRLPSFSKKEKEFVRGTFDFFGLNYYTSRLARKAKTGVAVGAWPLLGAPDLGIETAVSPDWPLINYWLSMYPEGLRKVLSWVKNNYGVNEIFISEIGCGAPTAALHDPQRVEYYRQHLDQVLLAIYEDGVNVTGFTGWTLMDNYEWADGYTGNFGLYAVDFADPQRTRTPRSSAYYYADVIRTRSTNVSSGYSPHADVAARANSGTSGNNLLFIVMAALALISLSCCIKCMSIRRKFLPLSQS